METLNISGFRRGQFFGSRGQFADLHFGLDCLRCDLLAIAIYFGKQGKQLLFLLLIVLLDETAHLLSSENQASFMANGPITAFLVLVDNDVDPYVLAVLPENPE